jgi:hypothetical protein
MVDVMQKSEPKEYYTFTEVVKDPFNELSDDLWITIHEDVIEELGWDDKTLLKSTVKLGNRGNVLVIERIDDLDNT